MKTLKSMLLGTGAAIVAATSANAADLPVVEPVDYVQICDLYGDGFFYIPGTNTCIELSGFVRFEARFNGDDAPVNAFVGQPGALFAPAQGVVANPINGLPIVLEGDADNFNFGARARLNVDTRTETELGTLRGFIQFDAGTAFSVGDGAITPFVDLAFIQFEVGPTVMTAGLASSISGVSGPSTLGDATAFESGIGETMQLAFAFDLGPATAAIAISDPTTSTGAYAFDGFGLSVPNTFVNGFDFTNGNGLGQDLPYLEGELNFDLGPVSLQTGAVIGQVNSRVRAFDSVTGVVLEREFDEIGFGVAASAELNLGGFNLKGGASYADGIADFGADFIGADARIGTNFNTPAALTTAGALAALDFQTVEAYSFYGQIGARLGNVALNLIGTYGHIEYPNFQGAGRTVTGGNEAEAYTVALNAAVQPVDGLTIAAEVYYTDVQADANVARSLGTNAAFLNTAPGVIDPDFDNDQFGAIFRIQRDF